MYISYISSKPREKFLKRSNNFVYRFLLKILKKISNGINDRKEIGKKSKIEQEKIRRETEENIDLLKKECEEVCVLWYFII